jgi:hypothetical protein
MGVTRRLQEIQAIHSLSHRLSHFQDAPAIQDFPFSLSPLIRGRGFFLRLRMRTCLVAISNGFFLPGP